jgi:signal transduction histidine kinase
MKRIFISFYIFIMISMLVLQFGFAPVLNHLIQTYLKSDIDHYHSELTCGVFYMLITELSNIEEQDWPDHIHMLQPRFGFPIALKTMETLGFSAEESQQLIHDLILVRDNAELFYQRIGQSAYVLQLGPFSEVGGNILERKVMIVAWIALPVFLSLLTLLCVYPFWRNLKKILSAAHAFGEGDLSTRVQIKQHSALMPVADAFNRMADRIQQLINSHRELTRAVSHELRTPLARIRFSLEIQAGADSVEECRRHQEGMQKDVDELEAMITELLTYARFDSRLPGLHPEPLPLMPWLREICAYLAVELESVRFNLRAPEVSDAFTAYLDPRQMGRAVSNLLCNAARYAHAQVDLSVECAGNRILLHVDDDGPGIPEPAREHVFEPFMRLDESRNRESGGFGLGLAIVQRIVEWHGGHASVSQSPLGGARFTLQWAGLAPSEMIHAHP